MRGRKNSFLLSSNEWGHQGNFKLLYFFTKRFYTHKKYKKHKTPINERKHKRQRFYALKNHLRGRKSLIRLFTFCAFNAFCAFCAFAWLYLCAFCAFCAFCSCKTFSLKENKRGLKLPWWPHLHYFCLVPC